MPERPKALAFELDPESLVNLRQAFPGWDIEVINGAVSVSISYNRDLETAALLVLGICDEALAAGAEGGLVLPVHAKELVSMVERVRAGNRPGRHTLGLNRAQSEGAGTLSEDTWVGDDTYVAACTDRSDAECIQYSSPVGLCG